MTTARRTITALAALAAVALPASVADAAHAAPPAVPQAKAAKPRIFQPRIWQPRIRLHHHLRPTAKAVTVAGVDAFTTATFECSWNAVVGTAGTLSGLQGAGVWALVYVYDRATGRWANAGAWVPADGIHQFVVGARDPYMYAYTVYARYAGGWRYSAEYTPIAEGGDVRGGAFCP
jgi:hypothetical protein